MVRTRIVAAVGLVAAIAEVRVAAQGQPSETRAALMARAQVWTPRDVRATDIMRGPAERDGFARGATVHCTYSDKILSGRSPKFACLLDGNDELKVKFGSDNGEVFAEVAATRLLWALGFGADRMYPVRVVCRGCPESFGQPAGAGERLIDPAVVERKMPGKEVVGDREGWSWQELDLIDPRAGGASQAQRDALKLLAVFIQHTDTKPEQQRVVCLDEKSDGASSCQHPFVLINDVGLTFGRANVVNANAVGSVNLDAWKQSPVWKEPRGCIGNLPRSLTGTLRDPLIGEAGRQFLGNLLLRLSDRQLHDLFEVARFERRDPPAASGHIATASVSEWVDTFKQKRQEILSRRCDDAPPLPVLPTLGLAPTLWLQAHSYRAITGAMNIVSLLGCYSLSLATAVGLTLWHRGRAGAALLVLLALTVLLVNASKAFVDSPRPDLVDGRVHTLESLPSWLVSRVPELQADRADPYGFPSGHVAAATAFGFGLMFLFGRRWAGLALAAWIPLLILSRVYLGREFLGDALGGFGVGVIATAIGIQALNLDRLAAARLDAARTRNTLLRVITIAGVLALSAVVVAVPDVYDAGRLLGVSLAVTLLVLNHRLSDAGSNRVRVIRFALTAAVFALVWWALVLRGDSLRESKEPVELLLAGSLVGLALLAGAWYGRTARR